MRVILCDARKAGLIESRPIDEERTARNYLSWLPDEYRADYIKIRSYVGAEKAREAIEKLMAVRASAEGRR